MAKTLAQIADETARQLGEEYSDLDVQEQFDAWLVETLHEILSDASWGFGMQDGSITSVSGQVEYSLALGTGDVTTVYRTSDLVRELDRTTRERLVDDGKDMTIQGEPEYWYEHGMSGDQKVIGLYPIPSAAAAYTVRSILDPSQLTRTTTFPLPEDFIPAVRNFIRKLYKESIGDYNGSDRAGMAFASSLRRIRTKYLNAGASKFSFKATDVPGRSVVNHLRFPDYIS
jgi:hypothetical protein